MEGTTSSTTTSSNFNDTSRSLGSEGHSNITLGERTSSSARNDLKAQLDISCMVTNKADASSIADYIKGTASDDLHTAIGLFDFAEAGMRQTDSSQFQLCALERCKSELVAQLSIPEGSVETSNQGSGDTAANEINNTDTRSAYKSGNRYQDRNTGKFTTSPMNDSRKTFNSSKSAEAEIGKTKLLGLEDLGLKDGEIYKSNEVRLGDMGSIGIDLKGDIQANYTPLKINHEGIETGIAGQVVLESEYLNETYDPKIGNVDLGSAMLEVQSIAEANGQVGVTAKQSNGKMLVEAKIGGEAEAVALQGVAEYKSEDLMPGPLLLKIGGRAEGNLIAAGVKGELGITNTRSGTIKATAGFGVSALVGAALKGNIEVGLDKGNTLEDVYNWVGNGYGKAVESIDEQFDNGISWVNEKFSELQTSFRN